MEHSGGECSRYPFDLRRKELCMHRLCKHLCVMLSAWLPSYSAVSSCTFVCGHSCLLLMARSSYLILFLMCCSQYCLQVKSLKYLPRYCNKWQTWAISKTYLLSFLVTDNVIIPKETWTSTGVDKVGPTRQSELTKSV